MNSKVILIFSSVLALAACSSPTNDAARQPTQTPWVIFVPVTTTPEPAIFTPLPTVTQGKAAATLAPTRAATTRPSPTRALATAPIVVQPTTAPACSIASVRLLFPGDGDPRKTRIDHPGGDTFDFKWTPYQSGEGDTRIGYQINVSSKRTGFSNGTTIYISHNKFIKDGQHFILDQSAVFGLAGGDDVTVYWNVIVVKVTGSFDDNNPVFRPAGLVACSSPSETRTIKLEVIVPTNLD